DIFKNIYLGLQNVNIILKKAALLKESQEAVSLISELRALRALMHFDLVRMYGPLYSNLGKGAIKADALGIRIAKEPITDLRGTFYRDKVSDVYTFVKQELEESVPNLSKARRKGYFDYWSGTALLAKVYLYMEMNDKAFIAAVEVIEKGGYKLYDRKNYEASWSQEYAGESIFELATSMSDNAGYNALGWMCSEKGNKTVVPTKDMLKLKDADPDDVRFRLFKYSTKDRCFYISGKYPGREGNVKVNNPKVLRLSEVYLIAAEAAFKEGAIVKAGKYLSDLREKRSTLNPRKYDTGITLDDLMYERAIELVGEGNRVWDMWRNQKSIVRYTSMQEKDAKGHSDYLADGTIKFDFYQTIYPIAERELELLPVADREKQQNPGY
ncbi:MAG: RagB/SusD family nutrient uptake outer membrane protein, partial [Bacteroidales bacterium]